MPEQDWCGPQGGFLKATGKSLRLALFIVGGSMALSVPAWPQTSDVTRAQSFDTQRLGVATSQVIPPIQQWACAHPSPYIHSTPCAASKGLVPAGSVMVIGPPTPFVPMSGANHYDGVNQIDTTNGWGIGYTPPTGGTTTPPVTTPVTTPTGAKCNVGGTGSGSSYTKSSGKGTGLETKVDCDGSPTCYCVGNTGTDNLGNCGNGCYTYDANGNKITRMVDGKQCYVTQTSTHDSSGNALDASKVAFVTYNKNDTAKKCDLATIKCPNGTTINAVVGDYSGSNPNPEISQAAADQCGITYKKGMATTNASDVTITYYPGQKADMAACGGCK